MTWFAVDIGGTKIRLTVFGQDLEPVRSTVVATAALRRGTPAFAGDLVGLLRAHRAQDHEGIGLVLNGVLRGGHVEYSSLMGGKVDFPLRDYLEQQLQLPVHVDDDIHAMGLAEYEFGLGAGRHRLAMLNLGTGIGVAYVEDGRVLRGEFAAGLLSEQLVWVEQLGGWRSLDRTVCGRGLREMYGELSGTPVEAVTVLRRFTEDDPVAVRVMTAFSDTLVWTLQLISRMYHPHVITLNGSVARAWALIGDQVEARYRRDLEDAFRAVLRRSGLTFPAERGVLLQARPDARPLG
ncbi:MAG: ROK family protein [Propionicimonas sp.]|nr:ROK family protein [Propionicimonas sp.]